MRAGADRVERLMECVRNWSGRTITQTTAGILCYFARPFERKKRLGKKRENKGSGNLALPFDVSKYV
jgi:hypothetical protein